MRSERANDCSAIHQTQDGITLSTTEKQNKNKTDVIGVDIPNNLNKFKKFLKEIAFTFSSLLGDTVTVDVIHVVVGVISLYIPNRNIK